MKRAPIWTVLIGSYTLVMVISSGYVHLIEKAKCRMNTRHGPWVIVYPFTDLLIIWNPIGIGHPFWFNIFEVILKLRWKIEVLQIIIRAK